MAAANSTVMAEIPLRFSDDLQSAYSAVISWLREEAPGFETVSANPEHLQDIPSIGAYLHKYFPTHFFKAYSVFGDMISAGADLVKWPRIIIVDVGAGIGTASIALAECLANINRDRIRQSISPYQTEVLVIALDPKDIQKQIATRLLDELSSRLLKDSIKLTLVDYIANTLAPGTPVHNIVTSLQLRPDVTPAPVIIVGSNLLNWLVPQSTRWDSLIRIPLKKLIQRLFGETGAPPEYRHYIDGCEQLIGRLDPPVSWIIGVETDRQYLAVFQRWVGAELSRRFPGVLRLSQNSKVLFENPAASYYAEKNMSRP